MHYIIGLGSSISKNKLYIKQALNNITEESYIKIISTSKINKTIGIHCKKFLIFYNSIILINTVLNPESLWYVVYKIEKKIGRINVYKNSPRTIDIDILFTFYNNIHTKNLMIPHCQFFYRQFIIKQTFSCIKKFNIIKNQIHIKQQHY